MIRATSFEKDEKGVGRALSRPSLVTPDEHHVVGQRPQKQFAVAAGRAAAAEAVTEVPFDHAVHTLHLRPAAVRTVRLRAGKLTTHSSSVRA